LLQRFNPPGGLQKSRKDLIFVTKDKTQKRIPAGFNVFNLVIDTKMENENKTKIFSQRLTGPPVTDRSTGGGEA